MNSVKCEPLVPKLLRRWRMTQTDTSQTAGFLDNGRSMFEVRRLWPSELREGQALGTRLRGVTDQNKTTRKWLCV